MKYNEELYDLSKSIEPTNTKKMSERDIALYQARLLKLIVEEVKFVKKHQAFIHDGCVRISFLKEPYCTAEPGFIIVEELLKNGCFYDFASEYSLYLIDTPSSSVNGDRFPVYYELAWYYENYYKKINEELGMQRKLTNDKGEN